MSLNFLERWLLRREINQQHSSTKAESPSSLVWSGSDAKRLQEPVKELKVPIFAKKMETMLTFNFSEQDVQGLLLDHLVDTGEISAEDRKKLKIKVYCSGPAWMQMEVPSRANSNICMKCATRPVTDGSMIFCVHCRKV